MKLHQLVHGYEKGHREISSSIRLRDDDADLVARLSDLSGSITSKGEIPPYITTYPLQSNTFYALARTWLDLEARRPGCVLTHTILVPTQSWMTLRDPVALSALLKKPSRTELSEYRNTLEFSESEPQIEPPKLVVPPMVGYQFIEKYFDHGIKPIICVGFDDSEAFVWHLLSRIWPSLRTTVSACSYAIQPMMKAEGYFDWMFVPRKYSSNFQEFKREHFVSDTPESIKPRKEFWYGDWFHHLFETGRQLREMEPTVLDLFSSLDSDPTSVRLLFLLHHQQELINSNPIAAAGLLDLIETMAPQSDSSLELKTKMCIKALKAITELNEPERTIEVLRAIDEKLQHDAYVQVSQQVRTTVQESVKSLFVKAPIPFLNELEQMATGRAPSASKYFLDGIVSGIIEKFRNPSATGSALRLLDFPSAAAFLVAREPGVAEAYLELFTGNTKLVETLVCQWLEQAGNPDPLIDIVLLHVTTEWKRIIQLILQRTTEERLASVLTRLASRTNGFEHGVAEVIADEAAHRMPAATRDWCMHFSNTTDGLIHVMAACYAPEPEGLQLIIKDSLSIPQERGNIISVFLQRCLSGYGTPYWLKEELKHSADALSLMLFEPISGNVMTEDTTRFLLKEVPDLTLPSTEQLLPMMAEFENRSFFGPLRDAVLLSLMRQFITGQINEETLSNSKAYAWSSLWYATVSTELIKKLISEAINENKQNCELVCRWLALAPQSFFDREYGNICDLIIGLLDLSRLYWSESATKQFLIVLRRFRQSEAVGYNYDRVCAATLRFCFAHTSFPVSPLVIETFYSSYQRVIESRTDNIFLEFFDWDKGKEMRKSLIRAFMQSNWPPGDLALAARDKKLVKKVIKRLLVTSLTGNHYLEQMVIDLSNRKDDESQSTLKLLRELRDNPSFSEDWY